MKLADKVAVITGGASGIGRESAFLFAREGARIVLADVSDNIGEETAGSIRANGNEAIFVHTDVRQKTKSKTSWRQSEIASVLSISYLIVPVFL